MIDIFSGNKERNSIENKLLKKMPEQKDKITKYIGIFTN
jgi:hypothetical protein